MKGGLPMCRSDAFGCPALVPGAARRGRPRGSDQPACAAAWGGYALFLLRFGRLWSVGKLSVVEPPPV